VTEEEWLACRSYYAMLDYLSGYGSPRKLRLLACGCCRQPALFKMLQSQRADSLVDLAERFADGEVTWQELASAADAAPAGHVSGGSWRSHNPVRLSLASQAARAVRHCAIEDAEEAAWGVARDGSNLLDSVTCDLIRDVFGTLQFHSVSVQSGWRTDTTVALARQMYDSRDFGAMPILADALQDAGCNNADILSHCRDASATHVRGCWVTDLVLGKQ
jgi:hypothetical protein